MDLPAEIRETHISTVFLVGARAYKLKKPVRLPFVDLSTRELREAACRAEVELNRRIAPDAYEGVAELRGPDGTVWDHLVVMHRMPDARRLAALATIDALDHDDLMAVARVIAHFHAAADRSERIDAVGTRDAVRAKWVAGFEEAAPFVGELLDREVEEALERAVLRYLDGREALFADRIARGMIVDGHGDLLADDIFLLDTGPQVLDCIDFDANLRYGDVLADVAFLAMDLERLGRAELGAEFLAAYRELTAESHPRSLEHHYVAMRAHIRAKVACLRDDREQAALLHALAARHAEAARVRLVAVGGGPGSGKSTVAAGVGDARGWPVLRSDEIRKDHLGISHAEHVGSGVDGPGYDADTTAATYAAMLDHARVLLARGHSVVLDATFADPVWRDAAAALARETVADLVALECVLPESVAVERVRRRARDGDDPSDADADVVRAFAARAVPWPEATALATDAPPDAVAAAALDLIDA